jgi:two-component system, chemotaxis family, response regulator Rcp1
MNPEHGASPATPAQPRREPAPALVPIEILLVEDNPADIALTTELFKDARIANHMTVAMDGEEAMAILRREGRHSDATAPDLVMLDLNLPRKDGREVLTEIKSDPLLRRIPVVVLTTSAADRDVLHAYDSHVNAYLTKPVDLEQFMIMVKAIENFWLTVVRFAPAAPRPPSDIE